MNDHASSDSNNVSFLSWVLPRENWALALYRHDTLDFDANYVSEPTVFGDNYTFPYGAQTDLEMITYGVSFAYNVNEHIALGAGSPVLPGFESGTKEMLWTPLVSTKRSTSPRCASTSRGLK